jgi:hypothetical protein
MSRHLHHIERTQPGDQEMKHVAQLAACVFVLGLSLGFTSTLAAAQEAKAKTCRMEQQCRWENFKKICTYVKVCR